jgi:hypothetical protein
LQHRGHKRRHRDEVIGIGPSGSGARARTRKFAVGMEDVVLKRDSQMRYSVSLGCRVWRILPSRRSTKSQRLLGVMASSALRGRNDFACRRTEPRDIYAFLLIYQLFLIVTILLSMYSSAENKGSVSLEQQRLHFLEPAISAVPMPSRGERAWLQSSLYGNVEMPACLACRPRSGVLVRS